jgi:hypothetical protein
MFIDKKRHQVDPTQDKIKVKLYYHEINKMLLVQIYFKKSNAYETIKLKISETSKIISFYF